MKLFILFSILCVYALTNVNGAAIDTVVEKEDSSSQSDEGSQAVLDHVDQECHQPREVGRCFALFHRYAFNSDTLKCEQFIYGGCGGNNNNFNSLEECETKCLNKNVQQANGEQPETSTNADNTKENDSSNHQNSESSTETASADQTTIGLPKN